MFSLVNSPIIEASVAESDFRIPLMASSSFFCCSIVDSCSLFFSFREASSFLTNCSSFCCFSSLSISSFHAGMSADFKLSMLLATFVSLSCRSLCKLAFTDFRNSSKFIFSPKSETRLLSVRIRIIAVSFSLCSSCIAASF